MIPNTTGPGGLIRYVHETFDLVVRDEPITSTLPRDELALRIVLMAEEFGELVEAMLGVPLPSWRAGMRQLLADLAEFPPDKVDRADLAAIAQESSDLLACIYGNALHYGFDQHTALLEVVRSNMTKLDEDGRPLHHPNGKIRKGPLFEPPDPDRLLASPAATPLDHLGEGQRSALAAVCALYLSESRWIVDCQSPTIPAAVREELLRRREVCTLITGGAQ